MAPGFTATRQRRTPWSTRWRVVRVANRLGLRPDLGLPAILDRIAALRGQPIEVEYAPLPRATGLCVFGDGVDTLFVHEDAEPLHQVLITLHESWHLIEDLVGPPLPVRLWRRWVARPLTRCGLMKATPSRSAFGDHSVFELDNLQDVLKSLPPELVQDVVANARPVKMRGEHNHGRDPAEVFARSMLQRLALDDDAAGTGSVTASLDHRRTGI
ncbi:hypothetical protein [Streptomyces phaeochromogenes]